MTKEQTHLDIRKKVIQKITVNPRYYAKMSEILDKLTEDREKVRYKAQKFMAMRSHFFIAVHKDSAL